MTCAVNKDIHPAQSLGAAVPQTRVLYSVHFKSRFFHCSKRMAEIFVWVAAVSPRLDVVTAAALTSWVMG